MSYQPVETDDGVEIRDDKGNVVAGPFKTTPPRDEDHLKKLFEDANINQPMRDLLLILFGVTKPIQTQTDE